MKNSGNIQKLFLLTTFVIFFSSCFKNEINNTNRIDFPVKYVSVKNFGVLGDGITDETIAFDKAQDYAFANKVALFLPNGYYKINLSLKYDSLIIFGETKPQIKADSLIKGAVIIGAINAKNKKGIKMMDLGVWSQSDGILTGDGLGNEPLNQTYSNITLLGTGYNGYKHGILCQSGSAITINNFTIAKFFHGIALKASNINVSNIDAYNCGFTSIIIKSDVGANNLVENVKVSNVQIFGDTADVYAKGGTILVQSYVDNATTKNINISNVKSQNGGIATIYIEQVKGKVDNVTISNCSSYKCGDNPTRATFDVVGGASNISFSNCVSSYSNGIGYRTNKEATKVSVMKSFENNSSVAAYEGPFSYLELNNKLIIY